MQDGVFQYPDGTWVACVQIQDGVERSKHGSMDEAVTAYKSGHRALNNTKVKRKNVPVYRAVPVPEPQFRWEAVKR